MILDIFMAAFIILIPIWIWDAAQDWRYDPILTIAVVLFGLFSEAVMIMLLLKTIFP